MDNAIALACPPEGFTFDPAPTGVIAQEERLLPFIAIQPIVIGILLEEIIKGGQSGRILQAKSGLAYKFNPINASS
jgi:hypothetical protein